MTQAGKPEEKLELAFRLYDIDRNGTIEESEMEEIIRVRPPDFFFCHTISQIRPSAGPSVEHWLEKKGNQDRSETPNCAVTFTARIYVLFKKVMQPTAKCGPCPVIGRMQRNVSSYHEARVCEPAAWRLHVPLCLFLQAIYLMTDQDPNTAESPLLRTQDIFHKMDINGDGVLSKEEFIQGCMNDETLFKLLSCSSPGGFVEEEV